MTISISRLMSSAAVGAAFSIALFAASSAQAQSVITDPTSGFSVGLGPNGELFDYGSYIGFRRNVDGYDPLAPGSPRDSWGVTSSGGSAYADQADYGAFGLTGTTYTPLPASSATAVTTTSVGLTVTQNYKFLQPNVLSIKETITNTSGGALTGVKFQRNIDWDVFPTEFNENSFANPIVGNVNDSTGYGFENPDPAVPYGDSFALGGNQIGDLGGGINVTLANLSAGGSDTITFLYGISQLGESVNGLMGNVLADGAYYWVATQSSEGGIYPALGANSAIIAVANIPEPTTWAMLALGFAGLGFAGHRRGRKASVAIA
jgi:hypothetical protein